MLRTAILTLLAVAATALFMSQRAESAATDATSFAGVHVNEPVVVFDVTGSAFAGTIHRHMTVYNSGFVTISKRNNNPFGNLDVDVQTAAIGPEAANRLLLDLVMAGAVQLPDQNISTADIPLTTLTILEGKTFGLSKTFSYWDGIGEYAKVSSVMNEFVTSTFPGF